MNEPKPIEEWCKMLPEPYRSQALESRRNDKSRYAENKVADSLLTAIMKGFEWSESSMGFIYWHKLWLEIMHGEIQLTNKSSRIPKKYQP